LQEYSFGYLEAFHSPCSFFSDATAPTARYAQSLLLQAKGDDAGSEALLADLLRDDAVPTREFARRLRLRLGLVES
jgi:hypothetical protein